MAYFFNFSFNIPFGMNNWFMPNFSFPNLFSQFRMPMFNYGFYNPFNYFYNNYQSDGPSVFMQNYSSHDFVSEYNPVSVNNGDVFAKSDENYKTDNLSLYGYNAFKGKKLANIAKSRVVGWTGYCAAYVKNAIKAANLGPYIPGDAYEMTNILKYNNNFKEISPNYIDVKDLPAGCILVYDKNVQGYSKKYGHTEITTGDGRAVSDGVTKNLHKKPSAIFIPV